MSDLRWVVVGPTGHPHTLHETPALARAEAERRSNRTFTGFVAWGEVRGVAQRVDEGGRWVRRVVDLPPLGPAAGVDPFVTACHDDLVPGTAIVSWGGPPIRVRAAPLAEVLALHPVTHRATWGLGLVDDLRGTYAGPVEVQAGYPVALPTPERPAALLRAVLRLELDRRARAVLFERAPETVRLDPDGGWSVGDGPSLPTVEAPDTRADLTTPTIADAAEHAARFAPNWRPEDPNG